MSKETTSKVARLAGRVLQGHKPTRAEIESLASSALAQAEAEQESVKAWGVEDVDTGKLVWGAYVRKAVATHCFHRKAERVVRVLIRRVRPRAAKARKRK